MRPTDTHSEAPPPRQHGLDLVRAGAIAWVMIYHAMTLSLVPSPDHWFIGFGWMGVDLFVVLSGFLIASQLLKPWAIVSRPRYGRFFARRALRTLPAFGIVLLLYFAFPDLREFPEIQPFWQFASFTENLLFDPTGPKAFSHVWSLCVEEQFYLLFPLVVAAVAIRPSARKTAAVLLAALVAGIAVRSWLWLAQVATTPFSAGADPDWRAYMTLIYYPTWSRIDGLLAGIALATLKIFRPVAWQRFVALPNLLLALGLAGIAGSILLFGRQIAPLLPAAIGFPLLSASIALVVAAASTGRAIVGKYRVPGGQALATAAYSLYLTQKIAYHVTATWLAPALGATSYARLGLAVLVALGLGGLLYGAVELPFLKLRDRWEGKSRTSIARETAEPRV
jgi:peptidoglycan/LPS O-acetylase OafA/YrhL